MNRMLSVAFVVTLIGMGGSAQAHSNEQECLRGSGEAPISAGDMKRKIAALGYVTKRLTTSPSCYKALIVDRDSGGRVQALFDMANGELVSAELAK